MSDTHSEPPTFVIVGGGAGGLELACRLGGQPALRHVILIDKAAFHIWKPSLHEVAAGTLDIHREGLSYFMLAKDRGFRFVRGEMDGLDREGKTIRIKAVLDEIRQEVLPQRTIAYDTLILALGSRSNFFGTPGADTFAMAIDSTQQAETFRLKLLSALARADNAKAGGAQGGLDIAIVGAGATGVELAAELRQSCADVAFYGLNHLVPATDVRITLLEGAPRILSALPEQISAAARQLLCDRGVVVKTSVRIASVQVDSLCDDQGERFPADLCVWAAGIQAPEFLTTLGLSTNKRHQVIVDARLCSSDPNVFAFGDCAQAAWGHDGTFLPARAQVAHQQAEFLHKLLTQGHTARQTVDSFKYRDYGSLVSIGHRRVVGSLMGVLAGKGLFVEGLFARLMYMSLHLMHHKVLLGILRTGALALGRLLLKRGAPRVKLH